MSYYVDQNQKLIDSAKALPNQVQSALGNIDIGVAISNIGDKYELVLWEIGNLYEEVEKRLTGKAHVENLVSDIKEKIDPENQSKASEIANDLNQQIFLKIREVMKAEGKGIGDRVQGIEQTRGTPANLPTEEIEHTNLGTQKELLAQMENPHTIGEGIGFRVQGSVVAEKKEEIKGSTFSPTQGQTLETIKSQIPNEKLLPPPPASFLTVPTSEVGTPTSDKQSVGATFNFAPPVKAKPASEILPLRGISQRETTPPPISTTPSIIGDRLSKPVSTPREKVIYKVDPYREPLN